MLNFASLACTGGGYVYPFWPPVHSDSPAVLLFFYSRYILIWVIQGGPGRTLYKLDAILTLYARFCSAERFDDLPTPVASFFMCKPHTGSSSRLRFTLFFFFLGALVPTPSESLFFTLRVRLTLPAGTSDNRPVLQGLFHNLVDVTSTSDSPWPPAPFFGPHPFSGCRGSQESLFCWWLRVFDLVLPLRSHAWYF